MGQKKILKEVKDAAKYLQKQFGHQPEAGIILGSGLGNFIDEIKIEKEIPYENIPNFPVSTVEGHRGKLVFGIIAGKYVVAMAGRFHFYEGYTAQEVAFPIRVMKLLGVKTLFLSNAAGTVNPEHKVGDIMIINDHISFFTPNPLIGRNVDEFGPRFPDMSAPYDAELISKAKEIAGRNGFTVREGVYVSVTGPTFETRAEYKMIHTLGADVVGMSTVQEAIVAVHMGMKVFAMSVVTDLGLSVGGAPITHEEVLHAAKEAEPRLALIFKELIGSI
jgi:purine-nucleoside phosphorylase